MAAAAAPHTDGPASNTRSGAWTPAEVAYAYALAGAFRTGLLSGVSSDCTMREYIAGKLNCDGMRVSKKRVCRQEGKATFGKSPVRTVREIKFTENQLAFLRRAYLDSVGRGKAAAPALVAAAPVYAATHADTAPGLMLLSLRKLPYPVWLWDGDTDQTGGCYRLDLCSFDGETLFSKRRTDIFVELRPPSVASDGRLVGCAAQSGMTQANAVAICSQFMANGGFHAHVHAPPDPAAAPRGWGVSVVTRALHRNLRRLLDAGGASFLSRLWVAVRPTDQDTAAAAHATGVVTPVRVLPPHAYCQLER